MKAWNNRPAAKAPKHNRGAGFTLTDLLVVLAVLAVLAAVAVPILVRNRAQARQFQCLNNLQQINRAVLAYSVENKGALPLVAPAANKSTWWFYKSLVRGHLGLGGKSSPQDKVFACPDDRGYDNQGPFYLNAKFDYGSYNFNGVDLPGVPNIAGRTVSSIKDPSRTLLMMEWTAHAPISWHKSRTGKENHPFYNDAESMVGFVDGRVAFIKIYFDGVNPAFTRDPIAGYEYKYSGD